MPIIPRTAAYSGCVKGPELREFAAAIDADPERRARMYHVLLTAGKGLPEAASVSDPRGTIAETDEREGTP